MGRGRHLGGADFGDHDRRRGAGVGVGAKDGGGAGGGLSRGDSGVDVEPDREPFG